jgi:hypothetical protein
VWSAEKRAEGLEYMHAKPSSHSGRIVGIPFHNRAPISRIRLDANAIIDG